MLNSHANQTLTLQFPYSQILLLIFIAIKELYVIVINVWLRNGHLLLNLTIDLKKYLTI